MFEEKKDGHRETTFARDALLGYSEADDVDLTGVATERSRVSGEHGAPPHFDFHPHHDHDHHDHHDHPHHDHHDHHDHHHDHHDHDHP